RCARQEIQKLALQAVRRRRGGLPRLFEMLANQLTRQELSTGMRRRHHAPADLCRSARSAAGSALATDHACWPRQARPALMRFHANGSLSPSAGWRILPSFIAAAAGNAI